MILAMPLMGLPVILLLLSVDPGRINTQNFPHRNSPSHDKDLKESSSILKLAWTATIKAAFYHASFTISLPLWQAISQAHLWWALFFILMNHKHIVTYCLALWAEHKGEMTQEDKDFFDVRVSDACSSTSSSTQAIALLLGLRMRAEGIKNIDEVVPALLQAHQSLIALVQ